MLKRAQKKKHPKKNNSMARSIQKTNHNKEHLETSNNMTRNTHKEATT
jgi:hypothetical protein